MNKIKLSDLARAYASGDINEWNKIDIRSAVFKGYSVKERNRYYFQDTPFYLDIDIAVSNEELSAYQKFSMSEGSLFILCRTYMYDYSPYAYISVLNGYIDNLNKLAAEKTTEAPVEEAKPVVEVLNLDTINSVSDWNNIDWRKYGAGDMSTGDFFNIPADRLLNWNSGNAEKILQFQVGHNRYSCLVETRNCYDYQGNELHLCEIKDEYFALHGILNGSDKPTEEVGIAIAHTPAVAEEIASAVDPVPAVAEVAATKPATKFTILVENLDGGDNSWTSPAIVGTYVSSETYPRRNLDRHTCEYDSYAEAQSAIEKVLQHERDDLGIDDEHSVKFCIVEIHSQAEQRMPKTPKFEIEWTFNPAAACNDNKYEIASLAA